ncbi:carbohydrate binding family 9 domain-containing protein, partial [candidate division KSB1 bacterium]|nr:carbohydrate binding family 9 domain-containing protein [candidate division KSB1 bacterium]NIR69694.1 carbohydrate binding family 9 domain-containing protein [candidate division KSB1 bacterium]NIS24890.1 carbohydrate binding family 9 domain-containing protein [candidate division KSB1 bacterium]NIT69739.1 carbohydrate binding family 9 domain-containing protein [candidate division KSB1 bacterium]NIU23409.1 carbohydrate binding family 9 domain-containing protein [candidate division KSB1 bacteri
MKTAEIALTIAILTLPALPKSSAALNDQKPKIVVPHVESPPEIENFLTMHPAGKIEKQMAKIEGFIQRTPKDGEPSPQHTEVYLCYDDENLYVVFVAFDSEPDKVRARMNRRENVFRDDIVEIMLDTFNDQRRAFAFLTNPLGVQWDALWTEGSGFDESFDTLWYSDGRLTDQGYVVWMSIPFKSLRFSASDKQTWGVVFVREIQRGQAEQSFWPRVSSRIEGRLNQAATLIINDKISPGRNMQFIPYGTYRTFRLLDRQNP